MRHVITNPSIIPKKLFFNIAQRLNLFNQLMILRLKLLNGLFLLFHLCCQLLYFGASRYSLLSRDVRTVKESYNKNKKNGC